MEAEYQAETLLKLAAVSAYGLWRACLVGDPPPAIRNLKHALENPRPGDWVLEISAGRWREPENALGKLIRIAREPVHATDPEHGETEPPMEPVYYLETLDGREFRWHNARMIRVFGSFDELRDAETEAQEGGA